MYQLLRYNSGIHTLRAHHIPRFQVPPTIPFLFVVYFPPSPPPLSIYIGNWVVKYLLDIEFLLLGT